MSLKCWFGAFKDAGGSWLWFGILNFDLDMFIGLWYTPVPKFGFLSGFWWCRENLVIEVLIWGLGGCCRLLTLVWYLNLAWIWSLVLGRPMFQILALYLDFQGAKTSMVFESQFESFEDSGGFWLGFGILIMIWTWSGILLWSSIMFWSHSDQLKLRLGLSRVSVQFSEVVTQWPVDFWTKWLLR